MNKKFDRIIIGIAIIAFAITPAVYSLDIRVLWAMILDLEANSISAMASAIIAGLIFITTLWQIWQNDKRNRLLVLPWLRTIRYESGHLVDNTKVYGVKLVNGGVGPAIIKKFELKFEGKTVSLNNNEAYLFINDILKDFSIREKWLPTCFDVIKAGEEKHLWSFSYNTESQNIDKVYKLDVLIEYQSVYQNETFTHPIR